MSDADRAPAASPVPAAAVPDPDEFPHAPTVPDVAPAATTMPPPDPDLDEGFADIPDRTLMARILVIGAILMAAVFTELAIATYLWPEQGQALWQGMVLEMFTGREAGIPVALQGGAPAWVVAQVSATQDIGVVCLAYPAFLWALHRYRDRDNAVMRRLRRLQQHAAKHRAFVHRWGPLGIFLFMVVPFLVNGPLLGAAAGRIAGIATKWLILPVVAATVVAALAWTYAYDLLFSLATGLDPRLPPLLTICIVGGLVAWGILGEILDARKARRQG